MSWARAREAAVPDPLPTPLTNPLPEPPSRRRPYEGCGEWCAPLHLVERQVEGEPFARFFDPNDFLLITTRRRSGRPDVHEYKHRLLRTVLTLDEDGVPYRFVPSRSPTARSLGSHRRLATLREAFARLGLEDLPWLKEELAVLTLGYTYEQRREHPLWWHWRWGRWEDPPQAVRLLDDEWNPGDPQ